MDDLGIPLFQETPKWFMVIENCDFFAQKMACSASRRPRSLADVCRKAYEFLSRRVGIDVLFTLVG